MKMELNRNAVHANKMAYKFKDILFDAFDILDSTEFKSFFDEVDDFECYRLEFEKLFGSALTKWIYLIESHPSELPRSMLN